MSEPRFTELRRQHPRLILQATPWRLEGDGLVIEPTFLLEPDITFKSRVVIKGVTQSHLDHLSPEEVAWWTLQVGLIETISYWKIACPPVIEIAAGFLTSAQQGWWHSLLLKGLGEFFFVNQIEFTQPNLVTWEVTGKLPTNDGSTLNIDHSSEAVPPKKILLALSGGKDSIVSQDLIMSATTPSFKKIGYLLVNPTPAALDTARTRPAAETLIIERHLDPKLLEMNLSGKYWNGHTPFSAMVAIVSSLAARLFEYEAIAVSNERSSNEGNVTYLGQEINHQYSKTFTFEKNFQEYVSSFAPRPKSGPVPQYFSLLRPLYELQIGRHFAQVISRYPELGLSFRSCNRGQKTNEWCGNCSKCLFAFLILSPFVPAETLETLFGQNLLDRVDLEEIALELIGLRPTKPFECVGTFEESLVALHLTAQRYTEANQPLPALLQKLQRSVLAEQTNLDQRAVALLDAWNPEHSVPARLVPLIKTAAHHPVPQVIGLLGLGREGLSSYHWLRKQYPQTQIWGCDDKLAIERDAHWEELAKTDSLLKLMTTSEWTATPRSAELVVRTPGLPPHHPLIEAPALKQSHWSSNTQLFFEYITKWSSQLHREVTLIGVTGTKGKSTTSAAIHHVLSQAGLATVLGGNIGKPALELLSTDLATLPQTGPLYVVLELSCHQLAQLPYSPNIAVVQNIVPEHLDYYPDFATYVQAKSQITRYQSPDDVVVFNPQYEQPTQLANLSPGRQLQFGVEPQRSSPRLVASVHDNYIWLGSSQVLSVTELPLKGEHNWENILPAVVIGHELGISAQTIGAGLRSFSALPHRLQLVGTYRNISFYNDSLSTVPEAAQAALAAFSDQPVVLIAGGYERHQDFRALAETLQSITSQGRLKGLVLFSPTGERLLATLEAQLSARSILDAEMPPHQIVTEMTTAVTMAVQYLPEGGVVLLSPASASFGLFKDYADRGDQFTLAVAQLQSR